MNCVMCGAPIPDGAGRCPQCGWAENAQVLAAGTVLQGKYRIESVLGQGGFGITYAASQVQLGTKLALKELFPSGSVRLSGLVCPPSSFTAQQWPQAKRDFTTEAQTLARFRNPDIVGVLDLFEENGTAYMVMEHLRGESLQQRITRLGALPPAEVEGIAMHILRALEVVHGAGLLHRDIKPDNIYLESSGRIVLIDFGSARTFIAGQTVQHTRLVTPGYAPMEQYGSAAKFGPYTDIYALGASLYHALSGEMPPPAPELLMGTPLPALPAGTPTGLKTAIEQSMRVRVTDRPQDALSVQRMIQGVWQPPAGSTALPGLPVEANVADVWQVIAAIPAPVPKPLVRHNWKRPVTPAMRRRRVQSALISILLGGLGVWLNLVGAGWFVTAMCFVIAMFSLGGLAYPGNRAVLEQIEEVEHEIKMLERDYTKRGAGIGEFSAVMKQLSAAHGQILDAPALLQRKQKEATEASLRATVEQRLKQHALSSGVVPGIGEKRLQILHQHGIRTAYEIEKKRVDRVPGIGQKITADLLQWRKELEQQVRRQTNAVPPDLSQTAQQSIQRELTTLIEQLRHGPQQLQAALQAGELDHQHTEAQLIALLQRRAELAKRL